MKMNTRLHLISISMILVLLCSCTRRSNTFVFSHEDLTLAEAQQLYSRTRWYFTEPIGAPVVLPRSSVERFYNSSQIVFNSTAGTRIIYEEHVPDRGLKAYHGIGKLELIENLHEPVFKVIHPNEEQLSVVRLVGFAGHRMVTVQADCKTEMRGIVFREALAITTNALARINRHF
jgi:hypothetical protein